MKIKKKLEDFLNELDVYVNQGLETRKEKFERFHKNGFMIYNQNIFDELENEFSSEGHKLYLEILDRVSNIKDINVISSNDYEKIAKIITYAKDIIDIKSSKLQNEDFYYTIKKLPNNLSKYYIPYQNFIDINKQEKTEGNYKFDAENYLVDYKNRTSIPVYAQATSTKNILQDQTDLFFYTPELVRSKKIYIISDEVVKKNMDKYFNVKLTTLDELNENLEIVRFLTLSKKIYTSDQYTQHKNIYYFFNTIFFSSKGFNNSYNNEMFTIFYKNKEFNIENLLFSMDHKKLNREMTLRINNYVENVLLYFAKIINFEYLTKNPEITEPMKSFLSSITILNSIFINKNKSIIYMMKEIKRINFFHHFHFEENRKKSFFNKIKDDINLVCGLKKLQKLKIKIAHNKEPINYLNFRHELFANIVNDCKLNNKASNASLLINLTDQEILLLAIHDSSNCFQNLLYSFKDSGNVKLFKEEIIGRIFNIIDHLNEKNMIYIYNYYKNMYFYSKKAEVFYIVLSSYFIKTDSSDNVKILELYKIFLLSVIFYPAILKNNFYPNVRKVILKHRNHYSYAESDFPKIIEIYQNYFKKINRPFIFYNILSNVLDFNDYDAHNLYHYLKTQDVDFNLLKTLESKLKELPVVNATETNHFREIFQPYIIKFNDNKIILNQINTNNESYYIDFLNKNIHYNYDKYNEKNSSKDRKVHEVLERVRNIYLVSYCNEMIGYIELVKDRYNYCFKNAKEVQEKLWYKKLDGRYKNFLEIDIIFLKKAYHRKKIGTMIINELTTKNKIHLMCCINKNDIKTKQFLQRNNFVLDMSSNDLHIYIKLNNKDEDNLTENII